MKLAEEEETTDTEGVVDSEFKVGGREGICEWGVIDARRRGEREGVKVWQLPLFSS